MNILLVGCSKDFGRIFLDHLCSAGHCVYHITSSATHTCNELVISWQDVTEANLHRWLMRLPAIDLIFFNQNGSSLSSKTFKPASFDTFSLWKQIAHWRQTYYTHCQVPFQIIHTLGDKIGDNSRIIWMLSSMVVRHRDDPGFADYIGDKFQNYLIMRNFARQHRACFFGIDPGCLDHTVDNKLQNMQYLIDLPTDQSNGLIFNLDGTESELYKIFQ